MTNIKASKHNGNKDKENRTSLQYQEKSHFRSVQSNALPHAIECMRMVPWYGLSPPIQGEANRDSAGDPGMKFPPGDGGG